MKLLLTVTMRYWHTDLVGKYESDFQTCLKKLKFNSRECIFVAQTTGLGHPKASHPMSDIKMIR